jgi:hypothetical protein
LQTHPWYQLHVADLAVHAICITHLNSAEWSSLNWDIWFSIWVGGNEVRNVKK